MRLILHKAQIGVLVAPPAGRHQVGLRHRRVRIGGRQNPVRLVAVPAPRRLDVAAQHTKLRVKGIPVRRQLILVARSANRRRLHAKRRFSRLQDPMRGVAVGADRRLHVAGLHRLTVNPVEVLRPSRHHDRSRKFQEYSCGRSDSSGFCGSKCRANHDNSYSSPRPADLPCSPHSHGSNPYKSRTRSAAHTSSPSPRCHDSFRTSSECSADTPPNAHPPWEIWRERPRDNSCKDERSPWHAHCYRLPSPDPYDSPRTLLRPLGQGAEIFLNRSMTVTTAQAAVHAAMK